MGCVLLVVFVAILVGRMNGQADGTGDAALLAPQSVERCGTRGRIRASSIQLLVVPEDAVLVERDPPLAVEIGFDVRPRGDAVVQTGEAGNGGLERAHAFGKGIAQPRDDLE